MPKPPFIPRYRARTHARGPAKLPRFPQYRVRGGPLTQRTMSHFSCIPRGITAPRKPRQVLSPDAPTRVEEGGELRSCGEIFAYDTNHLQPPSSFLFAMTITHSDTEANICPATC
ncbi:hypothetical protein CDAR_185101 [Caerostris darwini]|uniref:Uncharacterized protein n=1 Tax=Caerostris darwini TaxID=1538125 RepID=A0AAV4SNU9_9ARAC|nr:hypothetical protein CDAR_185101 [Caerostris darwini]